MSQIVGQVSSSGQPTIGASLFTAGRPSTGIFNIEYLSSFSSEPVVIVTGLTDEGNASAVSISDSSKSGFTVTVKKNSGDLTNRAFNFVATNEDK
ncbi:MAG: hypothetical protein K0U98_00340 [Deltaproteobacteria bacterium]|nr:hypothetical protein [Deltaproteobacteria bacterium]